MITKHFFDQSRAGREVLLYVNDELINSLGEPHGVGVDDFIEAVKKGPPWATRSGFCQKALQAFEGWREKGLEYPPYVGYLAFFVLAAVTETDFAPHSYYPGFWKRLGEPQDSGTPPSFDHMIELWDDLEKWSSEDKHEELGRFVRRIRGGYWKVGLPRSQTVLSESERKYLPNIFERAGLDPTDAPSPEIILKTLRHYGQNVLERRTVRLLDSAQDEDIILRNTLVDVVLDELEEWDGTVQYQIAEEEPVHLQVHTGLRLCLKLDSLAAKASSYVRVKTNRMFPEDGLRFTSEGGEGVWFCRETRLGWSTRLKNIGKEPPEILDGTTLDWKEGVQFIDDENHWRARLRPASIRLFRLQTDGLPDWVEAQRLERGIEFLVACSRELKEDVKKWADESCEQSEQRQVTGLPSGWVLFHAKNASKSCPEIDILSVSSTVRLLLRDGIKLGRGNVYFRLAPPKIVIENSSGSEKVTVNGVQLRRPDVRFALWHLPDDLPVGQPVRIEVGLDERRLGKIVRLEEFDLPLSFDEIPGRDRSGELCTRDNPTHVSGAIVHGERGYVSYPSIMPTHLSDRIIFIGGRPGEIASWPREPVPLSWQPVWAVAAQTRNRWQAFFCGKPEHVTQDYYPQEPIGDKSRVKRWREALWVRRRVTAPPEIRALRSIWERYVRAARNV